MQQPKLQWSHAISRVETRRPEGEWRAPTRLQWSHAISRVETYDKQAESKLDHYASMEPRDLTRGNEIWPFIKRRD